MTEADSYQAFRVARLVLRLSDWALLRRSDLSGCVLLDESLRICLLGFQDLWECWTVLEMAGWRHFPDERLVIPGTGTVPPSPNAEFVLDAIEPSVRRVYDLLAGDPWELVLPRLAEQAFHAGEGTTEVFQRLSIAVESQSSHHGRVEVLREWDRLVYAAHAMGCPATVDGLLHSSIGRLLSVALNTRCVA
ncbi:MAG: hypothetical protein AAF355_02425 [Myxococcota bacterium]